MRVYIKLLLLVLLTGCGGSRSCKDFDNDKFKLLFESCTKDGRTSSETCTILSKNNSCREWAKNE
jgi:hypothetical protein